MGHSSVERSLRSDVEMRHKLKNELGKKRSNISRLTQKLERAKKNRSNSRYSATIARLSAESEALEYSLYEANVDLQKRIADEMAFSEEEIQAFKEQYEQQYAEMEETAGKLKDIEEGAAGSVAGETSEDGPPTKELMAARTKRVLMREQKAVAGIQKEINSEERDKVFFARELQEIMAELKPHEENKE